MTKIRLADNKFVPAASTRLSLVAGIGLVVGLVIGRLTLWALAPLVAWCVAAGLYLFITWRHLLRFDAGLVKKHALREDPSRFATDTVLLVASIVSLVAMGVLLGSSGISTKMQLAALLLSL